MKIIRSEDTVKRDGKWVNIGKEGTHGEFRTKKQADAQRKAMFARGYKEDMGNERYTEIKTKEVLDRDGFYTDYTMYKDNINDRYVFVFGYKDMYTPDDGIFDWEADTEKEAYEWFDSYNGFAEFDEFDTMSEAKLHIKNEDTDNIEPSYPAPQTGKADTLSAVIMDAINDEYATIKLYNSIENTAKEWGYDDIVAVIKDINTEENRHVGQLQTILQTIAPNTKAIEQGVDEAEEQIATAPEDVTIEYDIDGDNVGNIEVVDDTNTQKNNENKIDITTVSEDIDDNVDFSITDNAVDTDVTDDIQAELDKQKADIAERVKQGDIRVLDIDKSDLDDIVLMHDVLSLDNLSSEMSDIKENIYAKYVYDADDNIVYRYVDYTNT